MKTKYLGLMVIGIAALGTAGFIGSPDERGIVVHEWGTFTSLQGSDGVPLKWNSLESSRLPKFVHDWQSPGLDRYPTGLLALGPKHALITFQRMETPVIYFYTDKPQSVDLSVRFPKGGITEWYPQAPEIGPSSVLPSPAIAKLDSGLHRCGVSPNFSLASVFDERNVKESLIHWRALKILPASTHYEAAKLVPTDSSGSHYFAARQTDSAYVEASSFSAANSGQECEKFLFYRGVGNFSTPLGVSMKSGDVVSVANNGKETLSHLFILRITGHAGNLVLMDGLKPGEQRDALLDAKRQNQSLAVLRKQIREQMTQALKAQGLYRREAEAMVNTWDDSWFAEEGIRVLYILPRAWTDETLPMGMDPKPRELVRLMVGRAELIPTETENNLARALTQVRQGQATAQQEFENIVAKLGRFAGPVFDQALDRAEIRPADRSKLVALPNKARTGQP